MKTMNITLRTMKATHTKLIKLTKRNTWELYFQVHKKNKVNIANRILSLIHKKFTYLDQTVFKQLHRALVRPHLEYDSVIWNPYYKYQKILIEHVQRRATRLLSSLKKQKLSYNERLIKLGLPSLEYRRERSDMLQTFRIVKMIDKK